MAGLQHPSDKKHHCMGGGKSHAFTQRRITLGHKMQCSVHFTTYYPNERCTNCKQGGDRKDKAQHTATNKTKEEVAAAAKVIADAKAFGQAPTANKSRIAGKKSFNMAAHVKKTLAKRG